MHQWESCEAKGKKQGKGRPKVTLVKVIKDISIKKVIESMTLDGIEW